MDKEVHIHFNGGMSEILFSPVALLVLAVALATGITFTAI